jgi:hypothetical protein
VGEKRERKMCRKFVYCVALLGFLIAFSCLAAEQPDAHKVVLTVGASAQAPDTDVTVFIEAIEDSRCPKGVSCIWEGDAVVKIRLEMPNTSPSNNTLHTNKRFASEIEHGGARIVLIDVTPYPSASAQPRDDDRRVTLSLGKK